MVIVILHRAVRFREKATPLILSADLQPVYQGYDDGFFAQ
jgi:hypothetical protein